MTAPDDTVFMHQALALAKKAAALGEVPVGAVVVRDGEVVGRGWNQPISGRDPSAHAEIMALRDAARTADNYRLPGTTLYVTIEPCTMCAGAIVHARVERLVYGAAEPKSGVAASNGSIFEREYFNHRVQVSGGVLAQECAAEISAFFARRREQKRLARNGVDDGGD